MTMSALIGVESTLDNHNTTVNPYPKDCIDHYAGHFIGNHSIIDIMRREGFAVDHIRPNDQLPG